MHRNRNPTVLLLASGWFWSPRPQTSVKSRNSLVSPSADIRRHVTACKAAVFLGRRHSQTQRQVIPKHFGLVRRHPQTSADIRRHMQTEDIQRFARYATLLFCFFTQSVDCVWLPIEARHCVGTTETHELHLAAFLRTCLKTKMPAKRTCFRPTNQQTSKNIGSRFEAKCQLSPTHFT